MKKYWSIAFLLFSVLLITSCSDDDDESNAEKFPEWKQSNEEAFTRISQNSNYTELKSESNNGSIYYKVLKERETPVDRDSVIYYNSTLKAYYTGWFVVDGESYEILSADNKDEAYIFDSADYPYKAPIELNLKEMIEGWNMTLPHMKVGERWEIWIPFQMAYGTSGRADATTGIYTILPYSTLKFEVEVTEIVTP